MSTSYHYLYFFVNNYLFHLGILLYLYLCYIIFIRNPGGKGANQAVAAARLKGNVHFIAKTGNDLFGKRSIEQYEDEGIHVENIYSDLTLPSGVALIMVDMNGENSIAIASGANGSLSPEDIRKAQPTIEKGDILLMQLEIPIETVEYAAQIASEQGIKVILNPAPARALYGKMILFTFLLSIFMTSLSIYLPEAGICLIHPIR